MNLMDFFRRNKEPTATTAKDRLQIVLAHERADRNAPDFLPALQKELLAVIKKYVPIDDDKVAVKLERESGCSMLEVNVELPAPTKGAPRQPAATAAG
ncbi:cell division topological specificity factor MinE [Rhodospirillum centenum]|uniref:Cell division topological specificity factor n=1 Tax=Rhodospirillum centenum (strain ATCC 51521 / SW) TaxID=414684 RepID=MINE_RHOCS|nr:cell division topological specificity factor MinE [Rhodospirillum centenum]B6IX35.1 RecName: Full=Cell division topological specificity factor [Rhodospirillum centenum SW]ACJ00859.1 cell division topological specificity factor MinE [Rhodospirillum centenum SW]